MKKTVLLILSLVGMFLVLTVDARQVRVRGYYRKNGTYVSPHVRNVRGSSKSSSSYRYHSYGICTSSYDDHSYSNSPYRTSGYQQRQPHDSSTSSRVVKESKRREQTRPFVSGENMGSDQHVDEEAKRTEDEKKKQESAKRQQEAVKQYQEAAELGNVKAQFKLAWCYEKGVGVKRDVDAAVRWYRKAAAQGDAAAQTALVRLGKR